MHRHSSCPGEYLLTVLLPVCVAGVKRSERVTVCSMLGTHVLPRSPQLNIGGVEEAATASVALSFLDCLKLFFKMSFTVSDFYHRGREACHPSPWWYPVALIPLDGACLGALELPQPATVGKAMVALWSPRPSPTTMHRF